MGGSLVFLNVMLDWFDFHRVWVKRHKIHVLMFPLNVKCQFKSGNIFDFFVWDFERILRVHLINLVIVDLSCYILLHSPLHLWGWSSLSGKVKCWDPAFIEAQPWSQKVIVLTSVFTGDCCICKRLGILVFAFLGEGPCLQRVNDD